MSSNPATSMLEEGRGEMTMMKSTTAPIDFATCVLQDNEDGVRSATDSRAEKDETRDVTRGFDPQEARRPAQTWCFHSLLRPRSPLFHHNQAGCSKDLKMLWNTNGDTAEQRLLSHELLSHPSQGNATSAHSHMLMSSDDILTGSEDEG